MKKADEIFLEILNLIGDVIKVYDKFCKNLDLNASDTLNLFKPDSTDLETISKQQEKLTLIKTFILINVLINNILTTRLNFLNTVDITKYNLDKAKITVFLNYFNDGTGFYYNGKRNYRYVGLFKLFYDLFTSYLDVYDNENKNASEEAKNFESNETVSKPSVDEINQVLTKYQLLINPIIIDDDDDDDYDDDYDDYGDY